jgi:integrase
MPPVNDRKPGVPESRKTDHEGKLVRFSTRGFGVTVFRQSITNRDGSLRFSGPFYYQKQVAREIERFPLGIDAKEAERLADEIAAFVSIPTNSLAMARTRYNPRAIQRETHFATIGEVIDAYEKARRIIGRNGGEVSETTFKSYARCLIAVIRKAEAFDKGEAFASFIGRQKLDLTRWRKLGTDILTPRLVASFKQGALAVAEGEPELDEEESLTAKITADADLRSARAILGKNALRHFKNSGMLLPDLSGFLQEPDYGAKKYFELLPPDVIESIMQSSGKLRTDNVELWRAFLLCAHAGLRKAEAIAFQLDWLRHEERHMIYVTIGGKFAPKAGHGRKVAVEPWVFDALKALGPVQDAGSLEKLKDWVAALIPKQSRVNKTVHELRKLWVSMKAKTEGLMAAQQQAGHRDPKTTTTHYGDSLMAERLLPYWKNPPA